MQVIFRFLIPNIKIFYDLYTNYIYHKKKISAKQKQDNIKLVSDGGHNIEKYKTV